MAIAVFDEQQLTEIARRCNDLRAKKTSIGPLAYIEARKKLLALEEVYYRAENLNPPIVIFNNISNTVIVAFIPLALRAKSDSLPTIFSHALPGAGPTTLTFVATLIFIVVFGEVIPKRIGRKYSIRCIECTLPFIFFAQFFFGWLGEAFQFVVEGPKLLLGGCGVIIANIKRRRKTLSSLVKKLTYAKQSREVKAPSSTPAGDTPPDSTA